YGCQPVTPGRKALHPGLEAPGSIKAMIAVHRVIGEIDHHAQAADRDHDVAQLEGSQSQGGGPGTRCGRTRVRAGVWRKWVANSFMAAGARELLDFRASADNGNRHGYIWAAGIPALTPPAPRRPWHIAASS